MAESDAWSTLSALLGWFGVLGAAFTLASNLKESIPIALPLDPPAQAWIDASHALWKRALFVLPTISEIDAALLSFMSFLVMNSVSASLKPVARLPALWFLFFIPILIFMLIFMQPIVAAATGVDQAREGSFFMQAFAWTVGLFTEPDAFIDRLAGLQSRAPGPLKDFLYYVDLTGLPIFILPTLVSIAVIAAADWLFNLRFNLAGFTLRLWKILACFAALVGLNVALLAAGTA